MDILRFLPINQYDAALNSNAPTAANPFATILDATGIQSVTFSQLLAIATPTAGDQRFVTNAQVQAVFSYNATDGKWTAPQFSIYNNSNGSDLVQGDVVTIDSAVNLSVETTTSIGDIEVVGVIVVGGADGTPVLVKYGGETLVNKTAGAIIRGDVIYSSTTAGSADYSGTGGIGDFGTAMENTSALQVRMQFRISESFG